MKHILATAFAGSIATVLSAQIGPPPQLPPVPFPPQNPITAQKAVLGKMLFWEEQMSSSDTVSCGTCHRPESGGANLQFSINPGLDGISPSPDDIRGTAGVVHMDAGGHFQPSGTFGLATQVTGRAAPSSFTSQYSPLQFWDGRSTNALVDPLTNQVVIPGGASLEAQSLGPILNSVEMATEGRTWAQVTGKLRTAKPMALATNLPADVAAQLTPGTDYPELFRRAFGDTAITPVRIALALATYERTLVPNQTPYDAFAAGNPNALTPSQQQGFGAFNQSGCAVCHTPPFFTDHSFRNLGVRPIAEDNGRQAITGNPGDAGRFKVPSLRGTGLKRTWMHNGNFTGLNQVLDFYAHIIPNFPGNNDPAFLNVRVPPQARPVIDDFIRNALTDPRIAQRLPPFDRPTLRTERPQAQHIGLASPGTGGFLPRLIDVQPAFPGAVDFRIGLMGAMGNSAAMIAVSPFQASYPLPVPVGVDLGAAILEFAVTDGAGPGTGYATWMWSLPDIAALVGTPIFAQGFVLDPGSPTMGIAATQVSRIVIGN
ncbi:MAG: cytochrome c peroxidase [Planctomycetota bacterium]